MGTFGRFQPRFVKLGLTSAVFLCWFLLLTGADSRKTNPVEVNALKSIKTSLTGPYQKLGNWNGGDPCTSNWTGIFCYNIKPDDGYLHVQEIYLMNMNLSGKLSPELGNLSYMKIMNFMWNNISGTIPREIGKIASLELLLLNGNKLTGSLPDEIGYLPKLNRLQIDENQISGSIPKSLANLSMAQHFHMNNNFLSGEIPPELYRLEQLMHLLLDNNNLSGHLPSELSKMPHLTILQLDNNNFEGSIIPSSYGNLPRLLKLSLRNCSLQGQIPHWGKIAYIDLSLNKLSGKIPTGVLSENMTTIDLSNNNLSGMIPASFSGLPHLQKLSLANNSLSGSVSSTLWQHRTLDQSDTLILDFRNNNLSIIYGSLVLPPNVTVSLQGNIVCSEGNLTQFCGSHEEEFHDTLNQTSSNSCLSHSCTPPYERTSASPAGPCFCAAPLLVGYRLKSPGFTNFGPFRDDLGHFISHVLHLNISQFYIDSDVWQKGPRLRMYLKIFPAYINNGIQLFNKSEVLRIRDMFGGWGIHGDDFFGPFELLNFTRLDDYPSSSPSGITKGALVGIILGTAAGSIMLSAVVFLIFFRSHSRRKRADSKRRPSSRVSIRIDGVKDFTYSEIEVATNNFNSSSFVGQGGYGKVYKGILADGTIVAIKRAQQGSLQGETEFLTEIELLSRLHHRNLVSLVGYCDEEDEQMLIYEFMSNGNLRDHLSGKLKVRLTFAVRLRIALGSAKGILYLHMEANPPVYHRDIKATNILLDPRFTAKVADFGLSRLAPVPDFEGLVPAHVSTVVKGTPGYLDPEYFLTHILTDKSDVYSLGVVFLELLTGMHPIHHGKNIVREVNIAYSSGTIFSIIDEQMGSYPSECAVKFIKLALNCCHDDTDTRPSMVEVVRELESIWLMIPESDTIVSESIVSGAEKAFTPASSSSTLKTSYVSEDISGNDLVSGVFHTVRPR